MSTVNGGEMVAQTFRKVKIERSDGMGGMEGSTRVTSKTVGVVRTVQRSREVAGSCAGGLRRCGGV